jgi:hypothetical protein
VSCTDDYANYRRLMHGIEAALIGTRARLRRMCRDRLPATKAVRSRSRALSDTALTLAPPLPLIVTHPEQVTVIMVCGSHTDTVATTTRRSQTAVELTLQHTNHTVLVEGPEITVRPVGTRRLVAGGSR